ncbi:hypothetical protein QQ020_35455 [Fulvivirgaceae bacterium BMA12]|uniref:Uncharacterized protein n=1 Tax=Agaribacillus aureus TaxID=3051825 RepID=A0ABT8LJT6_9BACT|nr:hypothetical protein [Fulvivirgaceae bacterium BMA12]
MTLITKHPDFCQIAINAITLRVQPDAVFVLFLDRETLGKMGLMTIITEPVDCYHMIFIYRRLSLL